MTKSLIDSTIELTKTTPGALSVLYRPHCKLVHYLLFMEHIDDQGIKSFRRFYLFQRRPVTADKPESYLHAYAVASQTFESLTSIDDLYSQIGRFYSSVSYALSKEQLKSLIDLVDNFSMDMSHDKFYDQNKFVQVIFKKIGLTSDDKKNEETHSDCSHFMLKALGAIALTAGAVLFTAAVLGALGIITLPSITATLATGATGIALIAAGSYTLGFFSDKYQDSSKDEFQASPSLS